MDSKANTFLSNEEMEIYEYALRDEFKGMHIPSEKQDEYIEKILTADEKAIMHLRKKGAIAISREILQEDNIFNKK